MAIPSRIHSLLEALGDLESAFKALKRFGRTSESDVVEKVASELLSEENPDELLKVSEAILKEGAAPPKPMTSQQKQKVRRYMKTHKPKAKKWLCCSRPKKRMTHGKSHKAMWLSTCQYQMLAGKLRGQKRSIVVVVGRGPRPPKQVMRKGKKLKWC